MDVNDELNEQRRQTSMNFGIAESEAWEKNGTAQFHLMDSIFGLTDSIWLDRVFTVSHQSSFKFQRYVVSMLSGEKLSCWDIFGRK